MGKATMGPSRASHWRGAVSLVGAWWIGIVVVLGPGCGDDSGPGGGNNNVVSGGICGDGIVDPGEACDDGAANSDTAPDACRTTCRLPRCGDGVADSGEACDDGSANSDRVPNTCRSDCTLPGCGDGVVDAGEACDDGNDAGGDGCSAACGVEPHWVCDSAQPTVCHCARYWRGPDCGTCVVFADVSTGSATADGASWDSAVRDLQRAVDIAAAEGPGCEVWIAQGTYRVFGQTQSEGLRLESGVALYGGFAGDEAERSERDPEAHLTVITAEIHENEIYSYHVATAIHVAEVLLDGVVLFRGDARGAGVDALGGGLLSIDSEVHLRNVRVFGNRAVHGAGIYVLGGSLTLEDCVITANRLESPAGTSRGGGLFAEAAVVRILGGWFAGNFSLGDADGVGAYLAQEVDAEIEDSVFERNLTGSGDGAGLASRSDTLVVRRSAFLANSAGGKGAGAYVKSAVIESSLFAANLSGGDGGGLYAEKSAPLWNCTVVMNESGGSGGGMATAMSSVEIYNSIFWLNDAIMDPEIFVSGTSGQLVGSRNLIGSQIGDITASSPEFETWASGLIVGTWTDVAYDEIRGRMTLTDANASYQPGALVGLLVNADTNASAGSWSVIADNTPTDIVLEGLSPIADVRAGDDYQIFDFRLAASSPCIDAGLGEPRTPALDLDGLPRYDAGLSATNGGTGSPNYVDVGCYEYHP